MKRCPKCSRTYTTDTQKFCTHDGVVLENADVGSETVRIEPSEISDQDAPTQAISRELVPSDFDPFKTVMARPDAPVTGASRSTQDLSSPSATLYPPAAKPPAPQSGSDQASPAPPQSYAPLPPPQSSPSAPTMALGSGPITASAPLPQPQPPPQSQSAPLPPQPLVAPPARKKSRLPLVLAILVVLLVLGGGVLGAAYFFVLRPMLARRTVAVEPSPSVQTSTPTIEATPNEVAQKDANVPPEPPAYSPPADAIEFVNSKENLDGKLAEHYLDFSFYYPNRWHKDPTTGIPGARNYVLVERHLPPDYTQESFAVAWSSSAAPVAENLALFHTMTENLSAQLAGKFPGYRKVSEGQTKAGVYDGYEFRFEGQSNNTDKGDLKLWGRVIFLPPQGSGKDGVTLLMLATSLAPELKSVDDVGVKGELPMMLTSFRFGKK
jgi:hypothetical protein